MATIEEFRQFVRDHGGDLGLLNKLLTPKGKDGLPLKVGEVVYGEDWKEWKVEGYDHSKRHSVICSNDGITKELKPEWLTHDEPDSFTKIASDNVKDVFDYWGCGGVRSCHVCPAAYKFGGYKPREYYVTSTCTEAKEKHVSERIEKLAKKKGVW